jgi:hypothetical protein
MSKNTRNLSLGLLTIAVLLALLPIQLPRTLTVAGRVLPAKEWLIVKNEEGGILAQFNDYQAGSTQNYSVLSIIRGDAFQFSLRAPREPGGFIQVGDTIVQASSQQLERDLDRLSGELAVARANLAMIMTGDKTSLVQGAERSLALARERATLQRSLFQRWDSLYQKQLASREEFEHAQSSLNASDLEVAIAESHLEASRSGSKPEHVRMIRAEIAACESQIRALSAQRKNLTLVSPLNGVFVASIGVNTLCTIEDTARIAELQVPVRYMERLAPGEQVLLRSIEYPEEIRGAIAHVDRRVRVVNGVQSIAAVARLERTAMPIPSHITLLGSIETDRVSVLRYCQLWLQELFAEIVYGATGV